ncbi:MAG: hypothetical protein QMD71_08370 [bacterium]|nr:hypothetical protein [bacterium]
MREVKIQRKKSPSPFVLVFLSLYLSLSGISCKRNTTSPEPTPNLMIPMDIEPVFSPNDKYIAYVHENYSPMETEGDTEGIFILDVATGEKNIFLRDSIGIWHSCPDWSPDGEWLLFVRNRAIYKVKIKENLTPDTASITLLAQEGFFPDWSPNGSKIAYDIGAGDNCGIWLMDSNGENKKLIKRWGREPDWLWDGKKYCL